METERIKTVGQQIAACIVGVILFVGFFWGLALWLESPNRSWNRRAAEESRKLEREQARERDETRVRKFSLLAMKYQLPTETIGTLLLSYATALSQQTGRSPADSLAEAASKQKIAPTIFASIIADYEELSGGSMFSGTAWFDDFGVTNFLHQKRREHYLVSNRWVEVERSPVTNWLGRSDGNAK
jgi:hypothetical protein